MIKIGLVGLGWVGLNRHVKAIARTPGLQLAGVADRKEHLAQEVGRRLGVPSSGMSSLSDVSWLSQVDAVDIATSPHSHAALIEQALKAGKHVITEKPFCIDHADAARLIQLAEAGQRMLSVVHNFQFASSALRLRRDMDSGRLGRVRSLSAVQWGNPARRLPEWYETLPLGLFFDESPHLIYLLRAFSPGTLQLRHVEMAPSTSGLRTPAAIDVFYNARTEQGDIPVSMSCKFECPVSEWHLAVHGEHGVGMIDVFRDIYIFLPNDRAHASLDVLRTSWSAISQHVMAHLINGPLHVSGRLLYGNDEVFRRFAEAIATGRPPTGISMADALDVHRMQSEIVRAAEAG